MKKIFKKINTLSIKASSASSKIRTFANSEKGMTFIEVAILILIILIIAFSIALPMLKDIVTDLFQRAQNTIDTGLE